MADFSAFTGKAMSLYVPLRKTTDVSRTYPGKGRPEPKYVIDRLREVVPAAQPIELRACRPRELRPKASMTVARPTPA